MTYDPHVFVSERSWQKQAELSRKFAERGRRANEVAAARRNAEEAAYRKILLNLDRFKAEVKTSIRGEIGKLYGKPAWVRVYVRVTGLEVVTTVRGVGHTRTYRSLVDWNGDAANDHARDVAKLFRDELLAA